MTTLIVVGNSEGVVGRCDSHCYLAREPRCACICGGRNHGVGLQKALENTARIMDPAAELGERMVALGGEYVDLLPLQAFLPGFAA